MTVQTFFVENDRNSEAAVFNKELLDGVRQLGHGARLQAWARVTGPPHLSYTVPAAKRFFGLLRVERSVGVDERIRLLPPHAHHLRGLLFERHSREQVRGAHFGRQRRILVLGRFSGARFALDGTGSFFHFAVLSDPLALRRPHNACAGDARPEQASNLRPASIRVCAVVEPNYIRLKVLKASG